MIGGGPLRVATSQTLYNVELSRNHRMYGVREKRAQNVGWILASFRLLWRIWWSRRDSAL